MYSSSGGRPMEPSRKPLNILARQINTYVSVMLKNGVEYKGTMIHCDNYMNVILDKATEHYNGELIANYGQILVRGNNIIYIVLDATRKK
ncbi:ribonucleoprotein [Candidatus Bathyarchaeota archaeon]|nr:MAG: ribonucleoprotein [Candidatus Bathyarchaeota archaeon]HDJ05061.1 ribonucleoprotein [Candidatus Bathyarchaeota archaeon]